MTFGRRFPTLVVVDSTVADYPSLISSVPSEAEILVLDPEQDGITQITQALATVKAVESLHILSHGSAGLLQLGATSLHKQTLERYAPQLQSWASALADGAEVLLYGCEVAAGTVGQWFVEQLKRLIGAEIAASTNLTGSAELGGDWALEFTTGSIQTPIIFAAAATAAYPHVLVTLVTDTFRNSDVRDKSWITGIGAPPPGGTPSLEPFLTARNTVAKPVGGIAGNPAIQLDPDGEGALRLTTNVGDQAAFALYNNPVNSNQGLTITFELYAYGGTTNPERADGTSFFLLDGTVSPTTAGAFGGSLGYAQKTGIAPGLAGGFLGIGFDEFGNYSSAVDAPGTPEVRVGGQPQGKTPDSIAIRGSQGSNYNFLGGTGSLPFEIDEPTAITRDAARRTVKVDLTPTGFLTVRIDGNNDGDFLDPGESNPQLTNVNVTSLTGTVTPATLKFGFAAGTGDFNNIHEIRNLVVSTLNNPPTAVDFGAAVIPGSTSALPGFSATDPDVPDDSVASYQILTLPDPSQGVLYIGDPLIGAVPVTASSPISPTDIQNIFFQAAPGFSGSTFTYTATDTRGESDPTPATVTLTPLGTPLPPDGNLGPNTNPSTLNLPQNTARLVPGLGGTDPDGTVTSFTILTLPPANEGLLFLGDPASGGTPITVGQVLTPAQIQQVYFQSSTLFQGANFTYTATDDRGRSDLTPAVVNLILDSTVIPGGGGCEVNETPILGTPGNNNRLTGTADIDTIRGFAGNDRILGQDCPDLLDGGKGNDRMAGGVGGDRLLGRQGRDVARGNNGNDVVNLGLANDAGFGGRGRDQINGRRGNDNLQGKVGDDNLLGGRGRDQARGGANRDIVDGQQGNDEIRGENGEDLLNGGLGRDRGRGGAKADRSFGRRGDDVLWGGRGRDVVFGNKGNDRISGNQSTDRLVGGLGDDVLTGGPGSDRIRTGAGADRILYRSALHGTDTIIDFNAALDRIDLRRAFSGPEYANPDRFAAYVRLRDGDAGTILRVDSNGDVAGGFVRLAILEGVVAASLNPTTNFLVA